MEHRLIHICGSMGSGKTTLIRGAMASRSFEVEYREGRKAPIGYWCAAQNLFVAGSYEVATASGCDTIKDTGEAFALLRNRYYLGRKVLYEGLFMMNHLRGLELYREVGDTMVVLRLNSDPDLCRKGILDRREATGNTRKIAPGFEASLRGSFVRAQNYALKMKELGCEVHSIDRDTAPGVLEQLLSGG